MPSTYTVNLGIEKPATGEQSGTWGDTTNTNFDILDQGINGAVRVTLSSAGSSGSPNALIITNGAASDGRNKWIEFYSSGDLGGDVFVQLQPNDAEKIVFIRNSLAGSRSVLLFQGTYNSGRDLEISAGVDMVVKFDGGGASAANVTDVYNNLKVTGLVAGTADINGGTVDGTVIGGASAAALTATTVVANTSVNIAGDGATVTGIKDEDNMASNSATKLATQQSIKAYVDSQVGTVDTLAEILANGNTTGSTDIDVDAAQKVQFRDAAIYINSSVDGQLDIVADTEIQIAATTIDINGAIVASGEISAASLDISGDVDIDGTLNVDAIDIDGAVQLDNTLTVGVDDTGYDVKFYGATGGAYMLWDESADDLILAGAAGLSVAGASTLTGVVTANAGIDIDNINIDGTTIALSSGDLTLDVAGDIILDADGGDVFLRDAGSEFGRFQGSSQDLLIRNDTQDKDISFVGNDGGVTTTALALDMSAAGAATFNDSVTAGSDIEIRSGNKLILQRPDNAVASNISTDSTGAMILDSLNGEGFFFNNNGTNAFNLDPINATFAGTIAGTSATFTTADNLPQLQLISTDADNNIGPVLDLWRNSASPADGDDIGRIYFYGENDASQKIEYVMMRSSISDVTDGTEDSQFQIYTYVDGAQSDRLHINPIETIFNEASRNVDFRVESDSNANMLHVDGGNNGVGIGTTGTTIPLTVNGGTASAATIQLGNHGDNASIHAKYNLAFKADSTEAIADRTISFGIGAGASLGLTTTDAIFNDLGADMNFRVESDANTHMLFVDGGLNGVGIGTSDRISSPLTIQSSAAANAISIIGRDNGASDEAVISFFEYDGTTRNAYIIKEAGQLVFVTGTGGAPVEKLRLGTTSTIVNEGSADQDFRVESDGNAHMLYVDGGNNRVGFGLSNPAQSFAVQFATADRVGTFYDTGTNGNSMYNGAAVLGVSRSSNGSTSLNGPIFEVGRDNGLNATYNVSDSFLTVRSDSTVINESSQDYDFRVESDSNTHAIYVDGANNSVTLGSSSTASNTFRASFSGFQVSTDAEFSTTKTYTFRDAIGFDNPNSSSYSTATAAVLCAGAMSTGRSINATGTVNASGADYAEYEANNGLVISKGSIVGFKADGTLTLTFSEAVRFGVKSTDPAYVGGDTWSDVEPPEKNTTAWDTWFAEAEVKRAKVDRVAYSGKVPVNVQGATAGQYIIAVANSSGEIAGQAVTDPDFSQYKLSVGRVNKILEDGRAELAVIIH